MLKRIWNYLTYNAYDENGDLKLLHGRSIEKDAYKYLDVDYGLIEMVLDGICESFDIKPSQKYQLRPSDNLAVIYGAMTKYSLGDHLEYERLNDEMAKWVVDYDPYELAEDTNITIERVIKFVATKRSTQQSNSNAEPSGDGSADR